jgi:hypothetical protein
MYPAQQLANGDYSENDLPAAVTVDGVSFNRSGTGYGDATNGVILEGNVWAKYRNGARSARPCLIQGGVVDQFASSYLLSLSSSIEYFYLSGPSNSFAVYDISFLNSIILNRKSLCLWESKIINGNNNFYPSSGTATNILTNVKCKITLIYSGIIFQLFININADASDYDAFNDIYIDSKFTSSISFNKESFQSSPNGSQNKYKESFSTNGSAVFSNDGYYYLS